MGQDGKTPLAIQKYLKSDLSVGLIKYREYSENWQIQEEFYESQSKMKLFIP